MMLCINCVFLWRHTTTRGPSSTCSPRNYEGNITTDHSSRMNSSDFLVHNELTLATFWSRTWNIFLTRTSLLCWFCDTICTSYEWANIIMRGTERHNASSKFMHGISKSSKTFLVWMLLYQKPQKTPQKSLKIPNPYALGKVIYPLTDRLT